MDVYWVEQSEADVPENNEWLGPSELLRLDHLRFPKRRREWRLGRWTAKCAVAMVQDRPRLFNSLADLEIRSAPSGSPEVFVYNQPVDLTISISHRAGLAVCAIACGRVKLGCDLEFIEPHSQSFVEDYLTNEEQRRVAQTSSEDRARMVALLWSGKESTLKAMRVGLRVDTRCITVQPSEVRTVSQWTALKTLSTASDAFDGWWRQANYWVQTLVADPQPRAPVQLAVPTFNLGKKTAGRKTAFGD
jgi:phosphopantetheinyl transferase